MKKIIIYLICGLTCITSAIIGFIDSESSFLQNTSKTISIVSGACLSMVSLYDWFIWKRICRWKPKGMFVVRARELFIKEPCVDGKWECELTGFKACFKCSGESDDCSNCECHKPCSQKAIICIIQKRYGVIVKYESSTATSFGTDGRLIQDEDGKWRLFYSYLMTPKKIADKQTNTMHYGYVNLVVSEDWKKLEGKYVTERETYGDMKLTKEE